MNDTNTIDQYNNDTVPHVVVQELLVSSSSSLSSSPITAIAPTSIPTNIAGTSQSIIDDGCIDHDPNLYHYNYIWPNLPHPHLFDYTMNMNHIMSILIQNDQHRTNNHNDNTTTTTTTTNTNTVLQNIIQQYHRDGFIVFPNAIETFSLLLEDHYQNHNIQSFIEQIQLAITDIITGQNTLFTNAVLQMLSSQHIPDFTSGQKIPWIQYEANTHSQLQQLQQQHVSSITNSNDSTETVVVPFSSSYVFTTEAAPYVRKIMGFIGYSPIIDMIVQHPNIIQLVSHLLYHNTNNTNNNTNHQIYNVDTTTSSTTSSSTTSSSVEQCNQNDTPTTIPNPTKPSNDIVLFQDMALLKPSNGGREKPWHQDMAYFNIDSTTEQVVGCWMAIDDAKIDNGCLRFHIGQHKYGPQLHYPIRDYQMCDTVHRDGNVIVIPLPPGGMIFFDGFIPHGTPTNTSTSCPRRALQFHWTRKHAKTCTTQERMKIFGGIQHNVSC